MALIALCNKSVTIESVTVTQSAGGGQVFTYATAEANVPCSLQPSRGTVKEEFAKRSMVVNWTAYFPGVHTLAVNYRINDGGVYYIVMDFGDMAGRGVGTFAHCLRKDQ